MNETKVKKPVYKKWWFWLIIVVLAIAIFMPDDGTDTDASDKTKPVETEQLSDTETYAKENSLTEGQAKAVFEICEKLGIEPTAMNENHEMTWEGYLIQFAFDDDKITAVGSGSIVFYMDGIETVYRVPDLLPTTEEKSYAKTAAEDAIPKILKAPSTAEFPGKFLDPFEDWQFSKDADGNITAKSYVDSQNSFGAMIRSTFEITFKFDGTNYSVVSLIFDGEQVI